MQRSNARIKLDRHLGSAFYQLMAAACVHVAWLRKSSGQFGLALDALKTVKLERAVALNLNYGHVVICDATKDSS